MKKLLVILVVLGAIGMVALLTTATFIGGGMWLMDVSEAEAMPEVTPQMVEIPRAPVPTLPQEIEKEEVEEGPTAEQIANWLARQELARQQAEVQVEAEHQAAIVWIGQHATSHRIRYQDAPLNCADLDTTKERRSCRAEL